MLSGAVERTAAENVELSVVVPVYGCAPCLRALHARLHESLARVTPRYELIFVDDRSPDGAWETLLELAHVDPAVRGFRLSRNFGQDAAITAGLSCARGRWVVVIDCDLQEAPEEIPRLYETAREGFEIVQTVRRNRRQSKPRHLASRLYRTIVIGDGAANGVSTLSIVSRRVAEAFLSLGDRDREYRLALRWLGFTRTAIEIDFHERTHGKTSYTLRRLVSLGLSGIFFRTTTLLTWIVVAGFVIAVAGAGLAAYDVYDHFAARPSVPGYTSVVVIMLLLVGFLIITVGVVGMYVGRVFEQVKGRPLFIIDARTSDSAFPTGMPQLEPERTAE